MKQLNQEMSKAMANRLWRKSRQEIGAELFRLRSSANMTLTELSHGVNMPVTLLDHMETGFERFDLDSLLRLARFYGKGVRILLSDEPQG